MQPAHVDHAYQFEIELYQDNGSLIYTDYAASGVVSQKIWDKSVFGNKYPASGHYFVSVRAKAKVDQMIYYSGKDVTKFFIRE